ncbi:hypothetical protein LTR95_008347 [Oleoguttula sp. CCFEE 5521]
MPSPADGNVYRPFADLMKLETIDKTTYRSIAPPFAPGGNHPRAVGRAFGGHVYAQAAWAASQTVPKGFVIHNVTGWFILGGIPHLPFIYTVQNVRDGKSYCTRTVTVTQVATAGICFTSTCSFKTAEPSTLDVQEHVDLWKRYSSVLEAKRPEEIPVAPGMDVPWFRRMLEKEPEKNDKFPGLVHSKVDMTAFNAHRPPLERRQLKLYRPIGDMPDNANLHMCAHLYASDIHSLYESSTFLDVSETFTQMGSLAHTVILHAPAEEMLFQAEESTSSKQGNWFCREAWTTRASTGRATYEGKIWSPSGIHVVTLLQDGMIRLKRPDKGKL